MEFSAGMLALILAVSFGSAIVGGMGGFGTGIMLTATLTPILGIKAVVPILAFAGIIINSGRFWFYRNDFNVEAVKRILPPALLCLFAGTFIYRELDAARLAIVIGIVVLMSVPLRRFLQSRQMKIGSKGLIAGGGIFGFLNGIASGMGVVLVSMLLGAGLTGTAVLATDSLITIVIDVSRSLLFGRYDLLTSQGIMLGAMIGAASLPGSWIAARLVHRMGAKMHIVVIDVLIIIGGISLLINGVRSLPVV